MDSISSYAELFGDLILNGNPSKFHRYTSYVLDPFIKIESNRVLEDFREELIKWFNNSGIHCVNDNKIVFEIEIHDRTICIGFHDHLFSVGFDYYDENE